MIYLSQLCTQGLVKVLRVTELPQEMIYEPALRVNLKRIETFQRSQDMQKH